MESTEKVLKFQHFSVKVVALDELTVSDKFNRSVPAEAIAKIVKNFDVKMAQPITAVRLCIAGKDKLVVLNGAKTLKALKLFGYKEWLVNIVDCDNDAQYYAMYNAVSGSGVRPMYPVDVFRYHLLSGALSHVSIVKLAEKYNFRVPLHAGDRHTNDIRSHRALERVYESFGAVGVDKLFFVLRECFVQASPFGLTHKAGSSMFLVGLAAVINDCDNTEPDKRQYHCERLISGIKKSGITAETIIDKANKMTLLSRKTKSVSSDLKPAKITAAEAVSAVIWMELYQSVRPLTSVS